MVTKIGLVLQTPTLIPSEIGAALTASSNFFINYVAIQVASAHALSPPASRLLTFIQKQSVCVLTC